MERLCAVTQARLEPSAVLVREKRLKRTDLAIDGIGSRTDIQQHKWAHLTVIDGANKIVVDA